MSTHGQILIIEDDTTILELMAEYLQEEGYAVSTALTGDEARHQPMAAPQLILLDYGVSDKEGQSLAEIRQHASWNGVPIVLVSGHANLEHVAQVEHCAGFVRKPFEIDELLAVVRQFVP